MDNTRTAGIMMTTSPGFRVKKSIICGFALICIIWSVVIMIIRDKLVDQAMIHYHRLNDYDPDYEESVKSISKNLVIVLALLAILVHTVGLIGAIKEQLCMTITYAVLLTLSAMASIDWTIKGVYPWYNLLFVSLVTITAYSYARDLYRRRRQQQLASSVPIVIQSAAAPNMVMMADIGNGVGGGGGGYAGTVPAQWPLIYNQTNGGQNHYQVGGGGQQQPPGYGQPYNVAEGHVVYNEKDMPPSYYP
ncbi:uncharacterized protein LOC128954250 [Oppia nitens]|uniref:uncharacterized protein LOC128954250 n=1 Tax=Oppia nitens TaxID=1686743 RepID=UPI0023D9D730|nr:uncharacterized protein LOC128954250 [Oppia nitens]